MRLALSADARYVAFSTPRSAGQFQGEADVFVRDLQNDTTTQVGAGHYVSLSADGRYLAFSDIFRPGKAWVRNFKGTADTGDDDTTEVSGARQTLALGRWAVSAFSSDASDLVGGDVNGKADIFVRDLIANTTTLVSRNRDGTPASAAIRRSAAIMNSPSGTLDSRGGCLPYSSRTPVRSSALSADRSRTVDSAEAGHWWSPGSARPPGRRREALAAVGCEHHHGALPAFQ